MHTPMRKKVIVIIVLAFFLLSTGLVSIMYLGDSAVQVPVELEPTIISGNQVSGTISTGN